MTHGSLFSGIGGFDLAAEWMGWENKFHCEWNEFGKKVLKYYWPEAESFSDITKTDFTKYANRIDILTGGFPCQPYSVAGKRKGKEDERHLWPEMLRAIREIQPRWVVGENVHGIVNWSGGMVFDEVQTDLETAFKNSETYKSLKRIGYESFPYVLPACSVNAPHRRDRIWFVAHSSGINSTVSVQQWRQDETKNINTDRQNEIRIITNSNNPGTRNNSGINENRQEASEIQNEQPQSKFRKNGSDENASNANNKRLSQSGHESRQQETNAKFRIEYSDSTINTNTDNKRLEGRSETRSIKGIGKVRNKQFERLCNRINWKEFPTQSPLCTRNDGIPGRLDGITFPKWRNESIKSGGNAIVPQVVFQIFKAIEEYDSWVDG